LWAKLYQQRAISPVASRTYQVYSAAGVMDYDLY